MYLSVVAAAWKKFVFSSPNLVHLTVYLYLQKILFRSRSIIRCLLRMFLKVNSCLNSCLLSSRTSRIAIVSLQFLIVLFSSESVFPHRFPHILEGSAKRERLLVSSRRVPPPPPGHRLPLPAPVPSGTVPRLSLRGRHCPSLRRSHLESESLSGRIRQ
jgi:hypothetical protein